MIIRSSSSHQPGEAELLTQPKNVLFINEVADEIRKAGRYGILLSNLIEEIFSLLFADVVVLVSHAPVGLKNQLNVLARASADRASELGQNKSYGLQKREAPCSARKMVHKRPTSRGGEFIRVSGLHSQSVLLLNQSWWKQRKKKEMDILRALWKIKGTNISIFLRLFDDQVQPALTYAAEIWGAKKIKTLKKLVKTSRTTRQQTTKSCLWNYQKPRRPGSENMG